MTKYIIEESTLTGMADQVRALTGTTGPLKPGEMVTKIETSVEIQEENLVDLAEQAELIGQIFTALEGKASAKPVLQDKYIQPKKDEQIVAADDGYDGLNQVIVYGDANLVAENIVSGKTIFGVAGTADGGGTSGGGSSNIDICTVGFNNTDISCECPILAVVATVFENGKYGTYIYTEQNGYNLSGEAIYDIYIPNVVCGTKIYFVALIPYYENSGSFVDISGSAVLESEIQLLQNWDYVQFIFTSPSEADEYCTIYYGYDA